MVLGPLYHEKDVMASQSKRNLRSCLRIRTETCRRTGGITARAMTTDSDRISRLEGIIEQIAATLTALHQGQEALRTEMREGDAALRVEMREGDAALRVEMQNGDAALRVEMQRGDAELRSITNRILWINYGNLGNRSLRE